MSAQIVKQENMAEMVERVVVLGDLSKMDSSDRTRYYLNVCNSLGLNPLTRPFDYITLNNKLTLYAKKDATDQLRRRYGVSIEITSREVIEDICVVSARAHMADGRTDEEIGAVSIKGLAGEALANAMMKATTKAKRRVTLSICGLGMLDETEVKTIPDAQRVTIEVHDRDVDAARYTRAVEKLDVLGHPVKDTARAVSSKWTDAQLHEFADKAEARVAELEAATTAA